MSKLPRVANNACREYVLRCEEFNGAANSHSRNGFAVSGRRHGHLYVVYSYGHWPMYVCDTRCDLWFKNAHGYSSTTSKQQSQCYPHGKDCQPLPTEELEAMIDLARQWRTPEARKIFAEA
jgi:hypothetical protein